MSPLSGVANAALLRRLHALVAREGLLEADLLVHVGEADARRLYLPAGCSSMFRYCVEVLHLAEGVAYKRIAVARAGRRHPELLVALRAGELHLTAASLIAPHLGDTNARAWIAAARHRSANDVRRLIADRHPKPDVATSMTRRQAEARLPGGQTSLAEPGIRPDAEPALAVRSIAPTTPGAPAPSFSPAPAATEPSTSAAPEPPRAAPRPACSPARARTDPLGGERYAVRFTADRECHRQLQELRALMRHQIPDGDLAKILARAVAELHQKIRKQKLAETRSPARVEPDTGAGLEGSPPSRHIPAAIRRAVVARDGARCAFVSAGGRRCNETGFLEFHHVTPWARSRRHDPAGISLRCHAHNDYHARCDFGLRHMKNAAARPRPAAPKPSQLDPDGSRSSRPSACPDALRPEPPEGSHG